MPYRLRLNIVTVLFYMYLVKFPIHISNLYIQKNIHAIEYTKEFGIVQDFTRGQILFDKKK